MESKDAQEICQDLVNFVEVMTNDFKCEFANEVRHLAFLTFEEPNKMRSFQAILLSLFNSLVENHRRVITNRVKTGLL